MITVIALVVGIVLASLFLLWARAQPDAGMRLYVIGLGVTALIYVVFALIGGAGGRSLALEAAGLLLYGAAAWLGFRGSVTLLSLGWAMPGATGPLGPLEEDPEFVEAARILGRRCGPDQALAICMMARKM